MTVRINVGCGLSPVPGWSNYDSSFSVKLANRQMLTWCLDKLGRLTDGQREFIQHARATKIRWANAIVHVPEKDNSADVVYSSHMVEHLERREALLFFGEARRILRSHGIIRIAVPNIRWHVQNYLDDLDADRFIKRTKLTREELNTWFARFSRAINGDRRIHRWMYDGPSMCKLLTEAGFLDPREMESGMTIIADPGELNLEERHPESVFVEAINP